MAKNSHASTWAVSLTNFLDSGSIVAGAAGLTLWQREFTLSSFAVGLLGALSANAFGSALGAIIGGTLSDRYGRKMIYTYDMLVYMVGCLTIVFSINFPMLLVGFLVTGMAVGAGVPASWTYIGETSDDKNRAHDIGISQFSWSMGPVFIFILASLLAPLGLMGNRILFAVLAIIAFIAWTLQRKLPESESWVKQKKIEKASGIKPHPYKELFSSSISVKSILFLCGVYVFWNLVSGAMGFFMPYVYETVGGLNNLQANLLQALLWGCTALSGYFGFALYGDKINHRGFFFTGALMAVISWVILTFMGFGWTALLSFVIIWGLSAGIGAQAWYSLWAVELFPTKYRAGSQGFMFFIVRGTAGVWSIIFPMILTSLGFKVAGLCMIALLVVSLLIGTIWTPKTRGKSLDQITEERYGTKKVNKVDSLGQRINSNKNV
ncbi:MFS transporter [Ligilactobacillus pobuzihii]|uniref:L-rhamnose-proton symport n=1 Tax=Ligilactobacillus pobuzihii TaxID=449659 RepID=A0A0R2LQB3_9LACO|nr:MFS transporter [Ligilactobacillus pobuzihii]KRK09503.1 L-rhamnose-proton symport [Ligilactobacillus pobuzihii E100301 = KCTC 13174]KRO01309.1 L-rhamnose-proton symport [Ligilactobacillus pobuzihii]GEN48897.1 MFS transporter [Ligilactobacillus pobuzihii]